MIDFTSPNTIALANLIGVGLLGILAYFGKRYGERKEAAPPTSKDVVVQSLAIADTNAILNMASTLREANQIAQRHHEHDADTLYELKNIAKSLERMESLLGRQLDAMRSR